MDYHSCLMRSYSCYISEIDRLTYPTDVETVFDDVEPSITLV